MATVHFSLGSELGKRITEIAQEKLMYDLDVNGALNVYTQSLHGFPKDLAVRCITGTDLKLVVNGDEIELTEKEVEGYPTVDFKYFIQNWKQEFDKVYKIFERPLLDHTNHTRRYITIPVSVRDIMMGYENSNEDPYLFLKNFIQNDMELYLDDDSDFQKSVTDIELCRLYRDWSTLAFRRAKVIDFLYEHGFVGEEERLISTHFHWRTKEYERAFYNAIHLGLRRETDKYFESKSDIDKFLDAAKEIDNIKELKPIQDYEFHNAIWLAPDGTMYGMNGEIANMLHNTMADMLLEQGIIKSGNKREENNPYVILEESGWVKIHNDWVMFEPNRFDKPKQFMTDAQVERMIKYLNKHYKGIGKFGIVHNVMTTYQINQMDKFAINKLFDI